MHTTFTTTLQALNSERRPMPSKSWPEDILAELTSLLIDPSFIAVFWGFRSHATGWAFESTAIPTNHFRAARQVTCMAIAASWLFNELPDKATINTFAFHLYVLLCRLLLYIKSILLFFLILMTSCFVH